MASGRFNWKLLIVILIGLAVLAATAFSLRTWQKNRMASGRLKSGNQAYAERQWQQAASDLGKYIAVAGRSDVPVLLKYAEAQLNIRPLKRDNVQQAISTYRSILRLQPDNREASLRLIRLYLEMDMYGECELIARRQLEKIQDPNIRPMLVVALVGQRKFREAATELEAAIKAYPGDILAYEAISRLYEQRSAEFDPEKSAEYWLNEAVRKNPSSAMAYIVRGGYESRNKRASQAATDFEHAQNLDLSNTQVRLRLVRELINAGRLSDANEHLAEVYKVHPRDVELWQTWALWASRSGVKSQMVKVAKAGLEELAPSNLDFMSVAAELYINGGDYGAAGRCVETLSQLDIAPDSVAFLRGMLAEREGRGFQAVKYYREALELGNTNYRVRLALAELLSNLGDEQSAIQQMRLLISEHPDIEGARVYLAALLLRGGRADEAAREAISQLRDAPGNIEAKVAYVKALTRLLDTEKPEAARISQIEKALKELEDSSVNKAEIKLLNFQFALRCANFNKAEQVLTELQKIAPDDVETAIARVDFLTAQKKNDEALIQLKEMIRKFPDSAAVVRYMAMALDAVGRYDECESMLTEAIGRTKDEAAQRQLELLRAWEFGRANKPDQACKVLDALDSKFENDIVVKRELLKFKSVANNSVRAQKLIDEIRSFEGRNGTAGRYEQAKLWLEGSDFKKHDSEIVALLRENLIANPEDNESRLLLAMAYDKTGRRRMSMTIYREALNRSPRDLRIIIPTVAMLYRSGEYDEVDKIIKSAAIQNISHPILSGYELQNYLRQGQLRSAAEILDDMRATDPNNDALDLYLAKIEMRRNQFEDANRLLTALKKRQPDSMAMFSAMAELNIRWNKPAEAINLCNEAMQRIKTTQTYLLRGRVYDLLGESRLAQQDFEHATVMEPNNGDVWMAKAQFYTGRSQNEKAAAAWEKCAAINPDDPYVRQQALTFFFSSSDRNMNRRGRRILDEALAANPQDQRLQIWQARALLFEKTAPAIDKAINILTKATVARPEDVDGWSLLYQARLQKNESEKALDAVLQGLVFLPENRTLLLLKARAEASHTPELAIPTVKLLYEKDPNDAATAMYLAGLYMHGGNYKAAMAALDGQLSLVDPYTRRTINIARAVTLHKSGDKAGASKLFNSLVKDDPNDSAVMLAQAGLLKDEQKWQQLADYVGGWCRQHSGSAGAVLALTTDVSGQDAAATKAAEEILRNATVADQNSPELLAELARLLYVSGRSSDATAVYRRLIELDPKNLPAINNLAWIMCESMGDCVQALELAQKGLNVSPDYLDLIDTRGIAYFRLGKFDKAIEDFNTCVRLYPSHTPSVSALYFHLGRAYAALTKKQEAVKYLKIALESNQKIGGLSANDAAEAKDLLDGLLKG